MKDDYKIFVDSLKSAVKLLDLDPGSQLYQDIITISHHLTNPNFRIAVFGPFNHGKSTLLNAVLGTRALPIDLIPTTGAAITVKYGTDLRSRITLVNGTEIYRSGTEVLKQFAILDNDRRMRNDVTSVEVFCPHPFLDTGVEFLDLPGTNDREEQDNLVRSQLLGADLVVQLLDARKLMTLGERENLRDWLLDRNIKTVIFVVNFLNLLDEGEQKEVQNRLRFVAESFRADLPSGFSNLYRVDALPALRARLKGDVAAANTSGLVAFETALQNLVAILQKNRGSVRLPRIKSITSEVQHSLKAKIVALQSEINSFENKCQEKNNLKQRAATIIKQGFNNSFDKLRTWLSLENLREKYQADGAIALAESQFITWEINNIKKDFHELRSSLVEWLEKAYNFFQEQRPENLLISFPPQPQITIPPKPNHTNDLSDPGTLAVGGGIGWLLGGPLGAAVVGSITYLVNKNIQQQDEKMTKESYHQQVAKLCIDAVDDYLISFSTQGLLALADYQKKAEQMIRFSPESEPQEVTQKRQKLQDWQNSLNQLNRELEKTLGISIPRELEVEIPTAKARQSVYSFSGAGIKEDVGTHRQTEIRKQENTTQQTKTRNSSASVPPPPKPEDLEAKFRAWELDQEIAQMKAEMRSPNSQTSKQQHQNQSQQAPHQPKTQAEKDKITRAYTSLGLQPNASLVEIKQAYKTLVKKWHPDLFVDKPQLQQQAQDKMRLINEAYTILLEISN
ncbi:dynamin family protein [Fischerella sp. NIES-3754]|uniref:dynamin family protein n=1 Tax=Fischerella sp. NIES-3754 TaxID=1752063 RepID=UPI0007214D5C|nr:dynamin family protein [Fischerella sp. NIES-3754]BAU08681.1 dynamin family protein [Fischerella sp. NIES-3754]